MFGDLGGEFYKDTYEAHVTHQRERGTGRSQLCWCGFDSKRTASCRMAYSLFRSRSMLSPLWLNDRAPASNLGVAGSRLTRGDVVWFRNH